MGTCISLPEPNIPKSEGIIELKKKKKKKKPIPKTLKRAVWDLHVGAEKGTAPCLCCEKTMIRQIDFHCGHVIAEAEGGKTNIDNLRPICSQCNLSMGKQNLYEFKAKYFESEQENSNKKKKKES